MNLDVFVNIHDNIVDTVDLYFINHNILNINYNIKYVSTSVSCTDNRVKNYSKNKEDYDYNNKIKFYYTLYKIFTEDILSNKYYGFFSYTSILYSNYKIKLNENEIIAKFYKKKSTDILSWYNIKPEYFYKIISYIDPYSLEGFKKYHSEENNIFVCGGINIITSIDIWNIIKIIYVKYIEYLLQRDISYKNIYNMLEYIFSFYIVKIIKDYNFKLKFLNFKHHDIDENYLHL